MSGKAYTMKEMKNIVEYLSERKAFGEIKGRKMWKDLADSKVTSRTWQSLKETFLKRILPDIHNPYYKLSPYEIASFKQGHDVEARLNNKLELRSTSRNSTTESEGIINEEPADNKETNETNPAGEVPKQSESDIRASTETLVLDDCYDNAEDKEQCPKKSLRELITYSEPLTPMLQAVLDDFATDDGEGSNDEPTMQIVEHPEKDFNSDEIKETTKVPEENMEPENLNTAPQEEITNEPGKTITEPTSPQQSESEIPPPKNDTINEKNEETSIVLSDDDDDHITKNNNGNSTEVNLANVNKPKTSFESTQNSNTTTDTLLPDNQEGFKGNSQTSPLKINNKKTVDKNQDTKRAKKRANSQENPSSVSKKRLEKDKISMSDTDTIIKNKRKTSTRSTQVILTQKIPEEVETLVSDEHSKVDQVMKDDPPQQEQVDGKADSLQNNENISEELENPCLKSVSLYAEQFSNSKYTDSETSAIEDDTKNDKQNKKEDETKTEKDEKSKTMNEVEVKHTKANTNLKKTEINKGNTNDTNEVVILKSHSDSCSDNGEEPQKRVMEQSVKRNRDKALSHMFGFSNGGVTKIRRKSTQKYRKHISPRKQKQIISSESSDWTSDTGSEYVSPPRGRKNRQTRKYLKPKPARILSLEEEGGLFVMYGKKIYPVVKDGKIIKNYVNLTADNDNEQEESFWKLKYVEEKKRTAELTKLLNQVQVQNIQEEISSIPGLPTTSRNLPLVDHPKKSKEIADNKLPIKDVTEPLAVQPQEEKTIKIKFTKNNEEVQLEGHWSHVNPVLAQVMQLFQKEPQIVTRQKETTKVTELKEPDNGPQQLSGKSTPIEMIVDEEIQEKIDQIEGEIFKEIEQREKEKSPTPKQEIPITENNITKRKGRPRKSKTSATEESPAKKPKIEETESKTDDVVTPPTAPKTAVATRRTTRTPKKLTIENDATDGNSVRTRQTAKKSLVDTTRNSEPQDDVKYKFPSPPPANRKSYSNKSQQVTKNTRQRKSSSSVNFKIYSSPENLSLNSIESTQGYQDSDESPVKTYLKRKKRTSFTLPHYRTRSQIRSKKIIHPHLTDDLTTDSSNSYQGPPLKSMVFQNSTLKSDVYKSESYQLLMNNVTLRSKNSSHLERIDEASPISNELQYASDQICKQVSDFKIDVEEKENLRHINTDSSSNVTLPTSPVLSIVENISISKSLLNNSNDFLLEDKPIKTDSNENILLNELMETDGDISMPLMEQDCGVETTTQNGVEYHYNLNLPKTSTGMSESFLNKINIVNITDPTLSESIHHKLRDLILESAKKHSKGDINILMESCKDVEMEESVETKITKPKKRSSTPRKRQSTRKLKLTNTEPCIEEEHMETCSYTSRQSCPPVMQVFDDFDTGNEINRPVQISEKPKGRRKKDVIKVKISKPKQKKTAKEVIEKSIRNKQNSIHTDSGINDVESGVFLNTFNDSVDLIHNHSETCLNANECLGDSVEIIKNASKSIISLDSESNDFDADIPQFFGNLSDKMAYELFSSDAQDVSVLQKVIGVSENKIAENGSATVYHTPIENLSPPDSLITEDLSNATPEKTTRNTKWYLFSEDEISNTNNFDIDQNSMAHNSYGANLNQIFPITCAVPDLSTITEMSKENDENTRKSNDDTNTRNDLDSQSLFN